MHKIIVAGCGGMSGAWIAPALERGDCEIVALVDPVEANAKAKKEEYKLGCEIFSDLKTALSNVKADVVFDVTPPDKHCETVIAALRAGCHVFGEKPMADSLENAKKMIACSDETGKEYFIMQNYRYVPEIVAIKNFIKSNELDEIGQVSANFQLNPRFGGFRDEMDNPLILDMSIHTFDAARFLTGADPKSVYCREFNPVWSWYKGDASAVCVFEMNNGVVFDYRGCWCATGMLTPWNSEWRIACRDGVIFWDGGSKIFWDGKKKPWGADPPCENAIAPAGEMKTGHPGCMADMFDAIKNGTRPQTDCRDNIKSIGMVYKAVESSAGEMVMGF